MRGALEAHSEDVRLVYRAGSCGLWMWQEGHWRADEADHGGADEAILSGFARVCVLRCDEADDQASGDDAGNPSGVVVAIWAMDLGNCCIGAIEIDGDYLGPVKTEAYAGGIACGIAEEIDVGGARKKAMDGAIVGNGDDDGLAGGEILETNPGGIRRRSGSIGNVLGVRRGP